MTIEEDVEAVREELNRTWGSPKDDPTLDALDRIAAHIRLLEFAEPKEYANANRFRKERDELREVLRDFVGWVSTSYGTTAEAHGLRRLQDQARSVLQRTEGEVTATPNRP